MALAAERRPSQPVCIKNALNGPRRWMLYLVRARTSRTSMDFKIWSAAPTGFLPRDECARPAAGRLAPCTHWRESRDNRNRLRSANDQVQGKGTISLFQNPHSLVDLISCRHHHKDVHVAVLVRLAIGVGAKQDDLFGMKLLSDLTSIFPDHGAWNQFAIMPAVFG